jgi:putative drug exporter of the RND superfamily
MQRPLPVVCACTALLVLAAAPLARIELSPGSLAGLPRTLDSVAAARVLQTEAGAGALLPNLIVLDSGRAGGARTDAFAAAGERLTDRMLEDPEPLLVASGREPPWTDLSGRYALVVIAGVSSHDRRPARAFVSRLRGEHLQAARFPAGTEAVVGGAPAQGKDFLSRSYGALPALLLVLAALTFLLLVRAFRSLLLPLKALLLNAVSVAAACGVLVAVFDWGWGANLLGLEAIGTIEAWVPIVLFATLFGLSVDYELFLVLRMREHWEDSGDNAHAVALGLERSGRVVTAAALVMICAFTGFLVADVVALQQLGLGLVAGIVIDVTLVRALLLPALMALFGRYNWWLPAPLARLAGVPPAPIAARD